jgi:hypothetical protein
MKLAVATLMLASLASSAFAGKTISAKNAGKVLRAARRVEEEGDDNGEDDLSYLSKYTLKMIGCKNGETVIDPETGEYSYGAVVVRLCPSEMGCDSDATRGCDSGYGDFVVGLNTFVDAYFEDQRDNMQWDDMFQVDKYAECSEYEVEQEEDDANENAYADYSFYIGPTCTESEDDIALAVFQDDACTTASEVSFSTLSNGWELPFETGGMVSTSCIDCLDYNEDDAAYELREMCTEVYQSAASKCETNMEYYSYYGQNVQGCEYITEVMPAMASGGNGGKVFGWIVFIALIGGLAGYIVWWRKSKSDDRDDNSEAPLNDRPKRRRWWQRIFSFFSFRRRRN